MKNNVCIESFTLADGTTVKCDRKAAPTHSVGGHEQVCMKCYEAWMMDNDHQDYNHTETGVVADCPSCGTYDPRVKKGHTKNLGTTQVHTSHAACKHLPTPAARAKCRKERAK